jgi:putative acetyltransferase
VIMRPGVFPGLYFIQKTAVDKSVGGTDMESSQAGIKILHTDGTHADFLGLVGLLDDDLAGRYGELQQQYNRHNSLDSIKDVVILYSDGSPAACGAFKQFDAKTAEIKRVFVSTEHRRQGLGKMIMSELEKLSASKGYQHTVLETGIRQTEAIGLYKAIGYAVTENYGPYVGNTNSVCMRKEL